MGCRIYVDFLEIDLSDKPISIPCTYQLLDVKDINKRKGSTTKTISVPRTAVNDKIFGFAFDINARNNFDKYSEHRILIDEETLGIFDGFLKLTNVNDDVIEFFCFKDISKLKSLFGEKTLQDLNLSDLDHLYDATIFDTWYDVYPEGVDADYFYPVIDYGQFRERTAPGTSEEPCIKITDLYPMVYNKRLVRQVMLDNGYSLKTSFFDDPITAKTGIPFTNSEFIHSVIGGVVINGFQGQNLSLVDILPASTGTEVLEVPTEEFNPLGQWSQVDDDYTSTFNQTSTVFAQTRFNVSNNSVGVPAYFIVEKFDGSWSEVERVPLEGPTPFEQVIQTNFVISLGVGEKVRFAVEKVDAGATVTIRISSLLIDPSAGGKTIEIDEFVQLAPNLPKMKQADYISAMFKIYNWIISVDDIKGEVEIETYDNYYQGSEQVDMSQYLTLEPKPSIQYLPLDYSRKYDFKYKHDQSDLYLLQYDAAQGNAGYLFGDGRLYLDEKGEATTIGEVPFSPTIVEKSFVDSISEPTIYIEIPSLIVYPYVAGINTAHEPRMLINAGLQSVSTLSGGTTSTIQVEVLGSETEIPFCYFQKKFYNDTDLDSIVQNLSFSTPKGEGWTLGNIVDKYYRTSIQSLSVSPQVVAYFNLNSRIVSELNFRNLWYVDYFNAVFRLNKIIDYLPNSATPTRVELIKVGVYSPDVPQFNEFE